VIVAVPGRMPVAIPDVDPIVATRRLLLDHVPPVTALLNAVVPPTQVDAVPVMEGEALTVATTEVVTVPHALEIL
jgi:hypothetical protein